jgi:septum formation protein
MRELVLASRSPRRRQLLDLLHIPVRTEPADVPEKRAPGESPAHYAERLARAKAAAVAGDYVLGADTIVLVDDRVLEKPADAEEAVAMLQQLQGRTHQVITACALKTTSGIESAIEVTDVTFRAMGESFLRAYVATGEPMDKAGAYGIQGDGAALVLDLLERAGWPYTFNR